MLLQVLFHARVAAEGPAELGGVRFDIDDVAADLVAKLVGRHPHVFAGTERIDTAERQEHRWDELKRAEKQRESSVDGVPLGQPAVALAAKLTSRTARAGLPPDLLPAGGRRGGAAVRRRGPGEAGRDGPGGRAAHRGPPLRRRRPRRRARGAGGRPGPARARRRRVAGPLAAELSGRRRPRDAAPGGPARRRAAAPGGRRVAGPVRGWPASAARRPGTSAARRRCPGPARRRPHPAGRRRSATAPPAPATPRTRRSAPARNAGWVAAIDQNAIQTRASAARSASSGRASSSTARSVGEPAGTALEVRGHPGGHRPVGVLHRRREQRLLVGEVVRHHGGGVPGLGRDPAHAGRVRAVTGDHGTGGGGHPGPALDDVDSAGHACYCSATTRCTTSVVNGREEVRHGVPGRSDRHRTVLRAVADHRRGAPARPLARRERGLGRRAWRSSPRCCSGSGSPWPVRTPGRRSRPTGGADAPRELGRLLVHGRPQASHPVPASGAAESARAARSDRRRDSCDAVRRAARRVLTALSGVLRTVEIVRVIGIVVALVGRRDRRCGAARRAARAASRLTPRRPRPVVPRSPALAPLPADLDLRAWAGRVVRSDRCPRPGTRLLRRGRAAPAGGDPGLRAVVGDAGRGRSRGVRPRPAGRRGPRRRRRHPAAGRRRAARRLVRGRGDPRHRRRPPRRGPRAGPRRRAHAVPAGHLGPVRRRRGRATGPRTRRTSTTPRWPRRRTCAPAGGTRPTATAGGTACSPTTARSTTPGGCGRPPTGTPPRRHSRDRGPAWRRPRRPAARPPSQGQTRCRPSRTNRL